MNSLSDLIHDVSRLRKTAVDRVLKPTGITCSQFRLLVDISRTGSITLKQSDFASAMDAAKATIGGLVRRLEAAGFVERQRDLADRRAKRIVLTTKGAELLQKIDKIGDELTASLLRGLDASDVECAERVIHAMRENLLMLSDQDDEQGRPDAWTTEVA